MGMPMASGFTPMTVEQHIETLKARRDSVRSFVYALDNIIAIGFPLRPAEYIAELVASFEKMLNFDTDRSIAILEKELADRPKQRIERLGRLTAQRDVYEAQIRTFQETVQDLTKEHPELARGIEPLFQLSIDQVAQSLASVNQEISRLQAEIESNSDPSSLSPTAREPFTSNTP